MADGSAIGNRPAAPAMDRAVANTAWSQYNPRTLFQKCVFFIQAADRDELDEQMIRSEVESMISKHGGKIHGRPHPPFVTHIILLFDPDLESEEGAGRVIECRDLDKCTIALDEVGETKAWKWTVEHLVRHFGGRTYADPPHLAKYGDAISATVPQANLIPKPVLLNGWLQDCIAAKRLLLEEDNWGGSLVRARFPTEERLRLLALSRAATDARLLELERSTAALTDGLAGGVSFQTQPVTPARPGSTSQAKTSGPILPAPHPMFAGISNALSSSSAHAEADGRAMSGFKLSGSWPHNPPAPQPVFGSHTASSLVPDNAHDFDIRPVQPFKLVGTRSSGADASQSNIKGISRMQPNTPQPKMFQGATKAAPYPPVCPPGPSKRPRSPEPTDAVPPEEFAIAGPTNLRSEKQPRIPRTHGRKRVMFEDQAGTTLAAHESNDGDPPTIVRYTTATLRNTTNIADEPQALKRPAEARRKVFIKAEYDDSPPKRRRIGERRSPLPPDSRRRVTSPVRRVSDSEQIGGTGHDRCPSLPDAQLSRKEAQDVFESKMVNVAPKERGPLRCLVNERLRRGALKNVKGLYQSCNAKLLSQTSYAALMQKYKDMITQRLAVG